MATDNTAKPYHEYVGITRADYSTEGATPWVCATATIHAGKYDAYKANRRTHVANDELVRTDETQCHAQSLGSSRSSGATCGIQQAATGANRTTDAELQRRTQRAWTVSLPSVCTEHHSQSYNGGTPRAEWRRLSVLSPSPNPLPHRDDPTGLRRDPRPSKGWCLPCGNRNQVRQLGARGGAQTYRGGTGSLADDDAQVGISGGSRLGATTNTDARSTTAHRDTLSRIQQRVPWWTPSKAHTARDGTRRSRKDDACGNDWVGCGSARGRCCTRLAARTLGEVGHSW